MALDNEKLTERPALTNSQDTDIIHVVRGNVSYQKEAQNFRAGSLGALNDIDDVNAPSPQIDNYLKWSGTEWIAQRILLEDLTDVVIDENTLANGQVIAYDSTNEEWVNTTPSVGATTFTGLTDTPADYTCQNGKNVKVGYGLPQPTELIFTPDYFDFACSDEDSDLAVGTVFTMICNRDYPYVSAVEFSVTTAPTGANLEFDVLKNGSTIYTTTPSIDAGEKLTATASTQQAINGFNFSLAIGDELQVRITQVGSTVAGAGLKATMVYNNRVCV